MGVTVTRESLPGAPASWTRHIVRVNGERVAAHKNAVDAESHAATLRGSSATEPSRASSSTNGVKLSNDWKRRG